MNKIWNNNECIIFAYKADRKNSKIVSDITMRHLITKNDNGCLDENKIENYFVGIIGQLVYNIKYHASTINITSLCSINHETIYSNYAGELQHEMHTLRFYDKRVKLHSIEELINYIYDRLLLVYPYTKLSLKELYNNPSLKYYINLYYNHN